MKSNNLTKKELKDLGEYEDTVQEQNEKFAIMLAVVFVLWFMLGLIDVIL